MTVIRTLQSGEEHMWVRSGSPGLPEHEIENRAKQFVNRLHLHPEDPSCFLVAMDNETCLGRLRGVLVHDNLYLIMSVTTTPEVDGGQKRENETDGGMAAEISPVALALIADAIARNSGREIEAVNWNRPEDAAFDAMLRISGFRVTCEKAFVERNLSDFDFTAIGAPDAFSYKTFAQAGRETFVETLAGILEQNVNRDMNLKDPETELDECVAHAGTAFNPATWKLALLDGKIAGLVLPQLFHDAPEEGSIFNIGLLPAYRGRGLGRLLHARGLDDLKRLGATRYVGSTDIVNVPMRRIFAANGCREKGVRRIYRMGMKMIIPSTVSSK